MASEPKKQVEAHARVSLTVEVIAGTWGEDCKLDQLYAQAAREAAQKVQNLLKGEARVIGEPKVVAIIAEREK